MQVSKEKAQEISREIEKAAIAIFAKHGLEKARISTKYGEMYSLKIDAQGVDMGLNGVNLASTEARDYTRFASMYDLPEGLLGKAFEVNGKMYAFAGIATQRSKYPIYVREIATGNFSFFQNSVVRFLVPVGAK